MIFHTDSRRLINFQLNYQAASIPTTRQAVLPTAIIPFLLFAPHYYLFTWRLMRLSSADCVVLSPNRVASAVVIVENAPQILASHGLSVPLIRTCWHPCRSDAQIQAGHVFSSLSCTSYSWTCRQPSDLAQPGHVLSRLYFLQQVFPAIWISSSRLGPTVRMGPGPTFPRTKNYARHLQYKITNRI